MISLDTRATTSCEPRGYAAMRPFFETECGHSHGARHAARRRAAAASLRLPVGRFTSAPEIDRAAALLLAAWQRSAQAAEPIGAETACPP